MTTTHNDKDKNNPHNTALEKLAEKFHLIQFVDRGQLDPNELLKPMVVADPNIEGKTAEELERELTNHKKGGLGEMDSTLRSTEKRHPEIDLEAEDGDEGGDADT